MSSIKNRKEVEKFVLRYSVGEELKWKWLVDATDTQLQLYVSCDKGRGRKDLVDVVKQPSEKMGLGGALKEKISSFIHSEG